MKYNQNAIPKLRVLKMKNVNDDWLKDEKIKIKKV